MGQLIEDYIYLKISSDVKRVVYGARARRLFLWKSMEMPVPGAVLLSISAIRKIQNGKRLDI